MKDNHLQTLDSLKIEIENMNKENKILSETIKIYEIKIKTLENELAN